MTLMVRAEDVQGGLASALDISGDELTGIIGETLASKRHWSMGDAADALIAILCRQDMAPAKVADFPFKEQIINRCKDRKPLPEKALDMEAPNFRRAIEDFGECWTVEPFVTPEVALLRKDGEPFTAYFLLLYINGHTKEKISHMFVYSKGPIEEADFPLREEIITRSIWKAAFSPFRVAGSLMVPTAAH